jgi:hypothetical protein
VSNSLKRLKSAIQESADSFSMIKNQKLISKLQDLRDCYKTYKVLRKRKKGERRLRE